MTAEEKAPGGIDLNAEHLNLKVKRDGNGIPLPVSLQPIEIINIQGLVPVIINVTPANIPMIFGSVNSDESEPLADSDSDGMLDSARNEYFDRMIEEEESAQI